MSLEEVPHLVTILGDRGRVRIPQHAQGGTNLLKKRRPQEFAHRMRRRQELLLLCENKSRSLERGIVKVSRDGALLSGRRREPVSVAYSSAVLPGNSEECQILGHLDRFPGVSSAGRNELRAKTRAQINETANPEFSKIGSGYSEIPETPLQGRDSPNADRPSLRVLGESRW